MTSLERKVFKLSAAIGAALTVGVLLLDAAGGLDTLEKWLYDRRAIDCQYFRKPPTDQIVHLDIDDRALEAIGRWPWPRDKMAEMLKEIGRAGPKVIGTDITYSDPAIVRPGEVDEDAAMAQALTELGNVVIPVSLKIVDARASSDLEQSIQKEITDNLELTSEQLISRLAGRGYSAQQIQEKVAEQFIPARRQAMYDRIISASHRQSISGEQLEKELLPTTDLTVKSPLRTVFDDELTRAQAWDALQRFTLPPPANVPSALPTIPNELPIPSYTRAAKACGFADDNLTESVVRSMPMFVQCDDRVFTQWGLTFACVLADADLSKAQITTRQVNIPSAHGDLKVPLRWQYSAVLGHSVPYLADIPWFGTRNWQTMYDWPRHAQVVNHMTINVVWDIYRTIEKIRNNNRHIDAAIDNLLEKTTEDQIRIGLDPTQARKYREAPLPVDEPLSREKVIEAIERDIKDFGLAEQFGQAEPENATEEKKAEHKLQAQVFEAARKAMQTGLNQNRQLAVQLQSTRSDLHGKIAGKGVLIGWTATGAVDMVTTSLHARCPGVVVHGAIANALITGQWWRTAPFWVTAIFTLVLGLSISSAAGRLPPLAGVGAALAAGVGYLLFNGVVAYDYGHWILGTAGPLVAVGVTWSGCSVARLVIEGLERIRVARDLAVFEHEMDLAKNVQQALLPKEMPVVSGVENFGWTKPADLTGGDLFDLWTLPDGRLGILLADASGHGLAPSVIVSQVRTLVRALSEIETHPDGLLARVNARLAEDLEPARFVTAFLGFLRGDGELHWASAGHGPMLWCSKDGEKYQELNATGLPLGIMPEYMGESVPPIQLEMSGMFIVLSDGIFEAPDPKSEQFGIERVIETLNHHRGRSALEITAEIRDAVTKWQAQDQPVDDQTTVIIRRIEAGVKVTAVGNQSLEMSAPAN